MRIVINTDGNPSIYIGYCTYFPLTKWYFYLIFLLLPVITNSFIQCSYLLFAPKSSHTYKMIVILLFQWWIDKAEMNCKNICIWFSKNVKFEGYLKNYLHEISVLISSLLVSLISHFLNYFVPVTIVPVIYPTFKQLIN